MPGNDKQKQSLYFPEDMLREIMNEAIRLDRSLSWIVQNAWRLARGHVHQFPSVDRLSYAAAPGSESRPEAAPSRAEDGGGETATQVRDFLKGKFEKVGTS
jgi:uncharacterized small protein (TIGR04563 family)